LFGNFGLAYEYRDNWAGRYFTTEGTVMGLTLMPAIAYRINEQISVGIGLNIMYGIFDVDAAINRLAPGDGKLNYDDDAWGFGANLGILYEVNEATRFGLTYCSEVSLEYKEDLDISGVLLPLNPRLKLDIDKPQTLMASFLHKLDEKWAVMGNVGWEDWSQFGKIGIQVNSATSVTADRKYKDTWHGHSVPSINTQIRGFFLSASPMTAAWWTART
jgi:long-chain fatty acid transport protein